MPLAIPAAPEGLYILVNPFGLHDGRVKQIAAALRGQLVVDAVQALYQPPPEGSWGFASARKFLGVPDGAFLWGPAPGSPPAHRNTRVHADHLVARALGLPNALSMHRGNEAQISVDQEAPSTLSEAILDHLDHVGIRKRRRSNFSFLHDRLGDANQLALPDRPPLGAAPLYYPFLPPRCIRRSDLRKRRIWVSRMWPGLDTDPFADDWSRHLARRLLPLPIDQRYGETEMSVVVSALGL